MRRRGRWSRGGCSRHTHTHTRTSHLASPPSCLLALPTLCSSGSAQRCGSKKAVHAPALFVLATRRDPLRRFPCGTSCQPCTLRPSAALSPSLLVRRVCAVDTVVMAPMCGCPCIAALTSTPTPHLRLRERGHLIFPSSPWAREAQPPQSCTRRREVGFYSFTLHAVTYRTANSTALLYGRTHTHTHRHSHTRTT